MNERSSNFLRVLIAVLAFLMPVLAALLLSARQSFDEQASLATLYARDVLRRTDDTADQIERAFVALAGVPGVADCTPKATALMARLHVPSDRLQTVGYARDGRLMCSSLGSHGEGIPLPPPDYVSTLGNELRIDVPMPWSDDQPFLINTQRKTGFTAVVHPLIPVDVAPDTEGLSVGVFSVSAQRRMFSQGRFEPGWVREIDGHAGRPFVHGDNVVVVLPSARYDFAAYAALPMRRVYETLLSWALVLVPLALVAGGVLFWLGDRAARRQAAIPTQIRGGLMRDEFFLVYQPIVALADERIVGAEALIRWKRHTGEMVRPDLFIPAAEAHGLITDISARVMQIAARDLGDLFAQHPDFHLALNLSSADLHEAATLDRLAELTRRTGAKPGNLMVEATERGFVDSAQASTVVTGARAQGIAVAIDDFGTGYSSLSQLGTLPLDYLKIDKCFVDSIGKEAATSQVILHIIGMARGLGLAMIAEGVEHAWQADYLREHDVQYAQGWHFGKPMALAELRKLL